MAQWLPLQQNSKSEGRWDDQQTSQVERGCSPRWCSIAYSLPSLHKWHHNHSAKTCVKHPACRWLCSMVRWRTYHHSCPPYPEYHQRGVQLNRELGTTAQHNQDSQDTLHTVHRKGEGLTKNQPVPQVETPTFLGVTLDTRLTWKPHLEAVEAKLPQPHFSTTYKEVKTLLKQKQKSYWRLKNNGYDPQKDQINTLDRRTQTTIILLRTGHCGLRKHLKRLGLAASAHREGGSEEQTPEHILQTCPHLETVHQQFWPEDTEVGTKLWGQAAELQRTVDFLAATGLRI